VSNLWASAYASSDIPLNQLHGEIRLQSEPAVRGAGFIDYCRVDKDHGSGVPGPQLCREFIDARDQARVHDRGEFPKFLRVSKNNRAQEPAIDLAVRPQNPLPKLRHDLLVDGVRTPEQLVTHTVGVNHFGAQLLEHARHGAFSGGDPTCQSEAARHKGSDE